MIRTHNYSTGSLASMYKPNRLSSEMYELLSGLKPMFRLWAVQFTISVHTFWWKNSQISTELPWMSDRPPFPDRAHGLQRMSISWWTDMGRAIQPILANGEDLVSEDEVQNLARQTASRNSWYLSLHYFITFTVMTVYLHCGIWL